MTRATLLAALAGLVATGAVDQLASAWAEARRRRAPGARVEGDGRARTGARGRNGMAALAAVARGLGLPAGRAPAGLEARLAAAGAPLGLAPGDLMAVKATAALAGALLAVPLWSALPGRLGLAAVVTAPAGAFLAPDAWLARRARARGAAMARELPDVLDLLGVALQAGLAVPRALEEVGRRRPGLLPAELRAAARRSALGEPRDAVLAGLVARCPTPGVAALVTAIARAERHGAPLAPALAALAAEGRAQRTREVHEAAARAAPQIQLVVALVLVPAVLLLFAAALGRALVPGLGE